MGRLGDSPNDGCLLLFNSSHASGNAASGIAGGLASAALGPLLEVAVANFWGGHGMEGKGPIAVQTNTWLTGAALLCVFAKCR